MIGSPAPPPRSARHRGRSCVAAQAGGTHAVDEPEVDRLGTCRFALVTSERRSTCSAVSACTSTPATNASVSCRSWASWAGDAQLYLRVVGLDQDPTRRRAEAGPVLGGLRHLLEVGLAAGHPPRLGAHLDPVRVDPRGDRVYVLEEVAAVGGRQLGRLPMFEQERDDRVSIEVGDQRALVPHDRSALADAVNVSVSGFGTRRAVLASGFDYMDRPLDPAMNALETLLRTVVAVGPREASEFDGPVHPVHSQGRVLAWEIHGPRPHLICVLGQPTVSRGISKAGRGIASWQHQLVPVRLMRPRAVAPDQLQNGPARLSVPDPACAATLLRGCGEGRSSLPNWTRYTDGLQNL